MTIHVTKAEFAARLDELLGTADGVSVIVTHDDATRLNLTREAETPEAIKARRRAWLDAFPKVSPVGEPITRDEILDWIRDGRR